ncbi:MAG TPA: alpha/beta hydrolase-fold protein [Candidatus Nitrosotenuis sp.]|jgi:esterase/lipase superfamily enzyme|nr:alpha/beta hydrolase-fold protein [Candidatus Nitrosotenuis sp.]
MHIEKHHPHSSILGIQMPVAVYGHYGTPVLIFPTSGSDFEEYERFGMIDTLSPFIESGMVKLFCINSINNLSWFDGWLPPAERARRQDLYDRYVVHEVVPFIYAHCRTPGLPIATLGASFGAYHAANTLFRHPTLFRWCICMSGVYDVSMYFDGYHDDNCYFHNPVEYMSNLSDPYLLHELSRCSINIICGQGPWERVHWSRQMSDILWSRGIAHNFDLWGHDVAHDWPWWKVELTVYFPRLFG